MGFSIKSIIGIVIAVVMLIAVVVPITIQLVAGISVPTYVNNETQTISNNSVLTLNHFPVDLTQAANFINVTNATGYVLTSQAFGSSYGVANYSFFPGIAGVNYNGTMNFSNVNTTKFGTTALISYAYQQTGYDTSSTDRTIYQILPLVMAVLLLVVVFTMIAAGGSIE